MQSRLFHAFAIVIATLVLSPNAAQAQTVAAGPYYATPSWDQTLACGTPVTCPRFVVLSNMNSDAVLDRETGLVWEKSLSEIKLSFGGAVRTCEITVIGNRQGWRLPTVVEMRTLMDPSRQNPALPDGHPFLNVGLGTPVAPFYWTSTPLDAGAKEGVEFADANATVTIVANDTARHWCVRGPGGTQ
jgi:Protein of unknown function (DUF1566)